MFDSDLTFGVLGPLAVWDGGANVALGGTKQRILLASLLLSGERPVTSGRLVDALWGDRPPRSAAANLHTYVSNLRAVLPPGSGGDRIRRAGGGYALAVDDGELDLRACERLMREAAGARAAGDLDDAAARLEHVDGLWRGEPLDGLPEAPDWQPELARIRELRLTAFERLCAVRHELGRAAENISGVRALLVRHPLREPLWSHLIRALAATGQTAEALAAYADLRERLATELGADPGPALQALHEAILRGGPLPVEDAGETAAPTGTPRPEGGGTVGSPFPLCQLPPAIPDFVGREDVTGTLTREIVRGADGDGAQPPPVVVLTGPPGVGKSAVAVHAAHRLRAEFPDGQLFVDLAAPDGRRRDPAEALAEVLCTLDVVGGAVPRGLSERAALYRSKLSDRRVLVVIDDAAEAGQVRPLLPGTPGSAAIVTARRALDTLPGAVPVQLDVLPEDEGAALLTRIAVGADLDADPDSTTAIVRGCASLPLALRIAGAKLRGRSRWSPRALAERLADESGRLSELRAGDLAVRTSFAVTVGLLPRDAARVFRLLGVIGAPELPAWTVDALLGGDGPDGPGGAGDVLDALAEASLVQVSADDDGVRFGMHDLLRQYGRELAAGDSPADRRAAITRLLATWLGLADRAAARLPPSLLTPHAGPAPRRVPPGVPEPAGPGAAVHWFDTERRALLGAVALAAEQGMAGLAAELVTALVPYFDMRSFYDDWEVTHRRALGAARAAGDLRAESVLLRTVAQLYLYQDRYDESGTAIRGSRDLCARRGDRRGVGLADIGLGSLHRVLGRHDDALVGYHAALPVFDVDGERHIAAQVCASIANVHRAADRTGEARCWLDAALRRARVSGDGHRLARILTDQGELELRSGDPATARDRLREALAVFDDLDDDRCGAYARLSLARAHAADGETAEAHRMLSRALATFDRIGNRRGRATGLMVRGELAAAAGRAAAARHDLRWATRLWRDLGDDHQAADAERLLAENGRTVGRAR